MNSEEIKQLLERYYNGESTGDEERLLKEFFRQPDIPEGLEDEMEIFRYYVQAAVIPEPSTGFESKILSALDSADKKAPVLKRRRIYGILTGVAAALLILIGSYYLLNRISEPRDTFSDPALAYAETMKILYNVSVRLNDGTSVLEPVGKMEDITEKSLETLSMPKGIIEGKLKTLHKFRRTIDALEVINNEKQKNN